MTYGPFFEHTIVATHRDVTVGVDNPTMDIVGVYVYVSELRTKINYSRRVEPNESKYYFLHKRPMDVGLGMRSTR